MQFPDIAFLDCDRNLDGAERFMRSKNPTLSYAYINVTIDDKGNPWPVEVIFDKLLSHCKALAKEPSIKWVSLDGLTNVNDYIVAKVLKDQGSKKVMEAHYWNVFKAHLKDLIIGHLRSIGKNLIVACHEITLEKPSTAAEIGNPTVIGYRPAVQSGITDYFGGYFTDMWRVTCVAQPGNRVRYKLQVVRDSLSDLKNSLGLPSDGFTWMDGELGYDKIKPYIEKRNV